MSGSSSGCEDDVMRIKNRLDKMMNSKNIDINGSIDMLNSLKKLPIDLKILKNTGIGVVLNNLRKSCNSEELGTLAKSLLKNWKRLVSSESGTNQINTNISSPNSNSNDSSSARQPVSPEPPVTPSKQQLNFSNSISNGQSLKRSSSDSPDNEKPAKSLATSAKVESKTDNKKPSESSTSTSSVNNKPSNTVSPQKKYNPLARNISFTETKDPVRIKCRELLEQALELFETIENGADLCDVKQLAARCEDVIYAEFKNTEMKYKNRIRSRVANLKDPKNPKLRESVRLGIITPDRLATMTAEEMASDDLKNLRAKFTKEAIDDHQMARTQGAKTSLLTCSKCKKNNVAYSEMQTRSADEPMTTFAFCQECGHRWKFG